MAPVVFGSAVGGVVALTAAAVAAARRERVLETMGALRSRSPEHRRPAGAVGLTTRARRDGWPYDGFSYAAALLLAGGTGALTGARLLGFVGGLAGLLAGPIALRAVFRRGEARTADLLDEQFREAVVGLAAAVRAGLSLRRALEEVARESEPPLRGPLEAATDRLRVGEPLESVLASLADRLGLADASMLVTLLAIHRRSGGDLPAMLDEVGALVALRRNARRDMRALTAQGRASGAVLAVLPIAFVTLLSWTGGDSLGDFYRTAAGSWLLGAGLACEVLGFLWISRILRPRANA